MSRTLSAFRFPCYGLLLFSLQACSLNRTAARVTAGVIEKGMPAMFRESDPQTAREALPANLKLMEVLLESDPANRDLLNASAQGWCGYAFMFAEDTDPERASRLYSKGAGFALRALRNAGVTENGLPAPEKLSAKTAEPAFWYAFCRAGYVNLNRDSVEAIAELPSILPVAQRVLELAPSFYYNGPHAVLGAYHAIKPRILGGDPDKSREHFKAAREGAGAGFLLNDYMAARMCAVAAQDAEYFETTLNAIISAELKDDETRLANEVAKLKAKKLLEKKDELF